MRYLVRCIILLFFVINHNINSNAQVLESKPPLENVLEFELSFGAENLPNEYLLAQPHYIAVNDSSDIYVPDEGSIKVFDKYGNAKHIFGRPGEGPGEFGGDIEGIQIAPTGYIMVTDSRYYSTFSPNNKFLEKRMFRFSEIYTKLKEEHNIYPGLYRNFMLDNTFIAINDTDIIVSEATSSKEYVDASDILYDILVYKNGDEVNILAKYESLNNFRIITPTKAKFSSRDDLGKFHFAVLPEGMIAYTNTGYDIHIDKNEGRYIIHLISLYGSKKYELSHKYILQEIPDSVIDKPLGASTGYLDESFEKIIRKRLKKAKYLPPLKKLLADGNFLFAFTCATKEEETLVDIFDAGVGKYIGSAYLPLNPHHCVIKNGCAYQLGLDEEGFCIVEKYKIDPAVYGK